MFKRPLVKPMLGAAALIALGALLPVSSAHAGPASCSAYARDVAASEAPRRGLIDGVVIGTLDTVFTGGAGADHRYRRIYNEAYSECMDRERVAYVPRQRMVIKQYRAAPAVVSNYRTNSVIVTERPDVGSDEWVAYCSAKYRSFDPDTGTYVSYEGQTVPCR